jgi:hypothetical protein
MNFILFELAGELRAALDAVAADEPWQNTPHDLLRQARAAIAKAEAAGVTARLPATTTE